MNSILPSHISRKLIISPIYFIPNSCREGSSEVRGLPGTRTASQAPAGSGSDTDPSFKRSGTLQRWPGEIRGFEVTRHFLDRSAGRQANLFGNTYPARYNGRLDKIILPAFLSVQTGTTEEQFTRPAHEMRARVNPRHIRKRASCRQTHQTGFRKARKIE